MRFFKRAHQPRRRLGAAPSSDGGWFAVLCLGRTGSTYLTRLLDSHRRIACLGEAFGPGLDPPVYEAKLGVSRRDWLVQTLASRDVDARGFKLPMPALLNHPGLLGDLEGIEARIVLLKRRNKLAHFISTRLAQETGEWGSRHEYPAQRIVVDPWQLYTHVMGIAVAESHLARAAAVFPHFEIAYEHLSRPARLAELQRFLGVAPLRLRSDTVPGRTVPLRQAIANIDEILRVLEPTPLGRSLRTWLEQDDASFAASGSAVS